MPAATVVAHVLPASRSPTADVLDDSPERDHCTRWLTGADGRREAESSLQVSGMVCAACADIIEQALATVPGITRASVVSASQRATVRWDPNQTRLSAVIDAVRAAGYDAVPDTAAPARQLRQREHREALWRLFVASFCAMQVMMFATPSYVAAPGELSPDLRQLLNWGGWVLTLPVMWFSAGPFLRGAWISLRTRRIGMDVPIALALLVAFVASMGATFDASGVFGHEVYYDSLTMFLSFLLGARYLELRARHRAAEDLERALGGLPDVAERRRADGSWEVVGVHRLLRGDTVRVTVGQAFPADGVILQGATQVDEALLTGESEPVTRTAGDPVVAASVNRLAPVTMRVDRLGADTRYEAIVAMMRDALGQRPDAARLADRWAAPFLWAVLGVAALAGLVWSAIDPSRALSVVVAVLVVTCPCALSLAAPAALVAAAGGLARRGVVFKRLDAIEGLARVGHVCMDKTGTLTEDRLVLRDLGLLPAAAGTLSGRSPHVVDRARVTAAQDQLTAEVLGHARSLAGWSQHPIARALRDAAHVQADGEVATIATPDFCQVAETPGHGLQGVDAQGRVWRLGGWPWVGQVQQAASRPLSDPTAERAVAADDAAIDAPFDARAWLSVDGQPLAGLRFDEVLRDGAAQAVADLQHEGLGVTLLTGDTAERAAATADRLGLAPDQVLAQATPEDKLAHVAALQARGISVAMVGDGINDAPVLARADVSLAMGQGALVARTQADAVIVSNRPADLVHARHVASKTMRLVRQNLVWAALYNLASIPLALLGWLPPWAAGLGMACSSLVVVGNALRAAR
jgi:P-type Cu2+ transporter